MKDINWMTYLMLILASYRFTHLIVFDKITEFIRKPFMKEQEIIETMVGVGSRWIAYLSKEIHE